MSEQQHETMIERSLRLHGTEDAEQVTRIAPYVGRLALAAMAWEGRAIVLTGEGLRRAADFTPEGAIAELEDIIKRARHELGPLAENWGDIARIRAVASRLLAPIRELANQHRDSGRSFFIGAELERATQDAKCVQCGSFIMAGERMQRDPATLLPVHFACPR